MPLRFVFRVTLCDADGSSLAESCFLLWDAGWVPVAPSVVCLRSVVRQGLRSPGRSIEDKILQDATNELDDDEAQQVCRPMKP